MGGDDSGIVSVTRRIEAPAGAIFNLLADPGSHPDFDGSGMLRAGATNPVVSAVGDVFIMKMHNERLGDYEMDNHVVEYEASRRIAWQPALRQVVAEGMPVGVPIGHTWKFELAPDGPDATVVTETYDCSTAPEALRGHVDNGNAWVDSMTATLERLDQLCGKAGANTPSD
jgi:hypothetical protein